jgi:DNA invertase Pin-like site-specific DNA recombinase
MIRAALYARVSTSDQSAAMQLQELRAYAARRELAIAATYIDTASGANTRRPSLLMLLADARARAFDAVVVYRYDRFARSLRDLVNALAEFDALGVQFISLHEGTDTSTPNGRLIFGIFGALAEFERELIRERVRSGLAAARARGKRLGRRPIVVNVRALRAARAAGWSWPRCSRRFGASRTTLKTRLKHAEQSKTA